VARLGAEVKALPPALQAHLDEGTTTLAWCWRIVRADGVTLGLMLAAIVLFWI
jgi:hypothetical protein